MKSKIEDCQEPLQLLQKNGCEYLRCHKCGWEMELKIINKIKKPNIESKIEELDKYFREFCDQLEGIYFNHDIREKIEVLIREIKDETKD